MEKPMINPAFKPAWDFQSRPMEPVADLNSAFFADLAAQRDALAKGKRPTANHSEAEAPGQDHSITSPGHDDPPAVGFAPCEGLPIGGGTASGDFSSAFFTDLAAMAADTALATRPHRVDSRWSMDSVLTPVNPWMAMQAALAFSSKAFVVSALSVGQDEQVVGSLMVAVAAENKKRNPTRVCKF